MCKARLDAPSSADRSGGGADVPANGNVPAEGECPDCVFTIEDDDKVCDIRADLKTPTHTTGRDAGRGRP